MAISNRATELLSPESEPSFYNALDELLRDRRVVSLHDEEQKGIEGLSKAFERALDEDQGEIENEMVIYTLNSMDIAVRAMKG